MSVVLAGVAHPFSAGVGALVGGYLVGSLPVAWLVVRSRHGIDLRRVRRGGTGAVDALSAAGPRTAALSLLLEFAKGAAVGFGASTYDTSGWFVALAIAGCVAGDCFPLGFRRGGRGVVPLLSGTLVAVPGAMAMGLLVFVLLMATISRRRWTYEAAVALAVAGGLLAATRDARALIAAAVILAAILGRRAQRRALGSAVLSWPVRGGPVIDANPGPGNTDGAAVTRPGADVGHNPRK